MFKDLYQKYKIYGIMKFISYTISEIWYKLYHQLIKGSYSQKGEDLIVDKILNFKKSGFYVDIGAGDPSRFNNTKRFYLRGWYGLNIEPNINIFKEIERERKRDINLNIGIGSNNDKMDFFIFFPDTLSTFSKKLAEDYIGQGFKIVKKVKIETKRLVEVFEKYVEKKKIDFLSIDTEGNDLDVLKSNNWQKYRPNVICVEIFTHAGNDTEGVINVTDYLKKIGYVKKFYNNLNGIFIDSKIC